VAVQDKAPLHERLRYGWHQLHRLEPDELAALLTDEECLVEWGGSDGRPP
jgi:hypothetical protein